MDNNETKTDFSRLVPGEKRSSVAGQVRKEPATRKPYGERRPRENNFRKNERDVRQNSRFGREPENRRNSPNPKGRVFSFFGPKDQQRQIAQAAPLQTVKLLPGSPAIPSRRKEFAQEGQLRLLPLGGIGNVNKNMYVYEFGDDIILIDCGIGFPEDDMLGVDFLIPDITYLRDKISKVRGLIITHGHEDHIGAIPLIWPELKCPIYASNITCGFLKVKLAEHGLPTEMLNIIDPDASYKLGEFQIGFARLSHSIPDTLAIVIDTPIGRVVHSADYKFDWTPVIGVPTDVQRLACLGYEGVSLLLSDSLGAEKPGYTLPEKIIEPQLHEVARVTKGKIIVTTTSSNLSRIQMAMNIALAHGRKVAVSGRSMDQNIGVARNMGYLHYPEDLFVELDQIERFRDNELLLIVAGSQGQAESSLARAAYDDHRHIHMKEGDAVVFSTDPIPGNENQTHRLIDQLFARGVEVYYTPFHDKLHVSGHAAQEELKLMIGLIRPEVLMPIGGTERSTKKYVDLAKGMGYEQHRVYTPTNGEMMVFYRDQNGDFKGKVEQKIELKSIMVDGLGVGDLTDVVMRDRQVMSQDGILLVIIPIDNQNKQVSGDVELVSRGFVHMKESKDLVDQLTVFVDEIVDPFRTKPFDWQLLRKRIDDRLSKYIYKELHRKPMVLPVLFEV
ncbi:MAG: ribonuclease J [Patescibacteria group bacterium]|nr:MAG: ribonuclease J [Patescibacteria group bacterium]